VDRGRDDLVFWNGSLSTYLIREFKNYFLNFINFDPGRVQGIVMGMSVCLFVCLSARITRKPHGRSLPNFSSTLHAAVARPSSGGVAM